MAGSKLGQRLKLPVIPKVSAKVSEKVGAKVVMTEIFFHFNAPGKVAYACRLLRKAVNGNARVVVAGDAHVLGQLDTALWTFSPLDFIPHCFDDAGAGMVGASPVVLERGKVRVPGGLRSQILVNLGAQVPEGFERFERLIELVGTDDDDRIIARDRWKYYAHRGYALKSHDVVTPTASDSP